MEALLLYMPNVVGAAFSAVALFLMGSYFLSRGQTLKTMVLGQATGLGITLGFLIEILGHGDAMHHAWVSPLTSIFATVIVFALLQRFRFGGQRTTAMLVVAFLFLLSLNYIITAMVPQLESHFSNAFLGDLATASGAGAWEMVAISVMAMIYWSQARSALMGDAFREFALGLKTPLRDGFGLLSLALFGESIRHFGFLFTLGAVCIPAFFAAQAAHSRTQYFAFGAGVAVIGTLVGFGTSLAAGNLPTTSMVIVCMTALGTGVMLLRSR
ncbi:MAG TPA: hypothetical protein VM901_03250 [Bdellovibrionota bacterium]|jgi:ABC-type Mn2+/Zn2+ transport system permease subunit|nr:hypothetical protein [Bdellovibrionota bacterium]